MTGRCSACRANAAPIGQNHAVAVLAQRSDFPGAEPRRGAGCAHRHSCRRDSVVPHARRPDAIRRNAGSGGAQSVDRGLAAAVRTASGAARLRRRHRPRDAQPALAAALADLVGPMAPLLVEDAMRDAVTLEQCHEILAARITDPAARARLTALTRPRDVAAPRSHAVDGRCPPLRRWN